LSNTGYGINRRTVMMTAAASVLFMGNSQAPSIAAPKAGESGRVARVIDGDSFILALTDGSELSVRLSAIQAPRTAQRAARAWPYASESRAGLSALIKSRNVHLYYGGETRDRFGRTVAQVYTVDQNDQPDLWVQGEMVRLGLARVYSWKGELADLPSLYALETKARDRNRGIDKRPDDLDRSSGPFGSFKLTRSFKRKPYLEGQSASRRLPLAGSKFHQLS